MDIVWFFNGGRMIDWRSEYIAHDKKTDCTLRVYKADDGMWHWAGYDTFEGSPIPTEFLPWDAEGYDTFTEACLMAEKTFKDNYALLFESYGSGDTSNLTDNF